MERKEGSISLLMEETRRRGTFNPFVHPVLTRVLSVIAPHLYTEEELAIIEELHNNNCYCYQQKKPSFSDAIMEKQQQETLNICRKKRSRYSSDHHEGSTSKKQRRVKPKKNEKDETAPTPPPELPISVKKMIKDLNGTDIKFVMCKKLFNTDLNPYNNRLSLPLKEIKCDFLTENEKAILDSKKDDGKPLGLEVTVLDPYFREFTMDLKKWQMQTSYVYNLVRNWRVLLSDNNDDMHKGNELNIWSFRVNGKLYFTLNNNKED